MELGKRNRFFIVIYGRKYSTKDGTGVRDYIHITDLADAHLCALEHLRKDSKNLILNLGLETGFSVLEILEKTKLFWI